jgi:hypothetical protein
LKLEALSIFGVKMQNQNPQHPAAESLSGRTRLLQIPQWSRKSEEDSELFTTSTSEASTYFFRIPGQKNIMEASPTDYYLFFSGGGSGHFQRGNGDQRISSGRSWA